MHRLCGTRSGYSGVVAGLRLLGHSLLLVGKALLLLWLRTLRPQQIMLHLVSKRRQEVTSVVS